MLPKGGI
ncbi:Protein of unknown function [Pyronema omphalodes CBS 100304]|nr:Protein of unknown function [Pyronema omphalodes CBS 100304]